MLQKFLAEDNFDHPYFNNFYQWAMHNENSDPSAGRMLVNGQFILNSFDQFVWRTSVNDFCVISYKSIPLNILQGLVCN